ncbi:hypothetical protein DASC09_040550 [Saccharomycopsis crataegensis]|uniref:Uncharacterized protein n=1 Tax=Saccharomycopsis crataegensis TaxID=43959 RepID=A0AAV5QP88_9ASCO|nr:hypothetical protein DASC09_040550 [Saccharomycopsis crataegensis]
MASTQNPDSKDSASPFPDIRSPNPDHGFLVIDAGESLDTNTWSLILTDDEARSTSSSESGSIEDVDADNIFSDYSDDEFAERNTASQNEVKEQDHRCSTKSTSIGEGIAKCFQLPKISLKSRTERVSSKLSGFKLDSWSKKLAATLLVIMFNVGMYYQFFNNARLSQDGVSLLGYKENILSPQELYTTVLVKTTATKTEIVQLPAETITIEHFGFQVPDYVKSYYSNEGQNVVKHLKSFYDKTLKDHKLVSEVNVIYSGIKNEASKFGNSKVGEFINHNVIRHFSAENSEKAFRLGQKGYKSMCRIIGEVGNEIEGAYVENSPIVIKFFNEVKEQSAKTGVVVGRTLQENYLSTKSKMMTFNYSKAFDESFASLSNQVSENVDSAKQLSNNFYQSDSVQNAIESGNELAMSFKNLIARTSKSSAKSLKYGYDNLLVKSNFDTIKDNTNVLSELTKKVTDRSKSKVKHASKVSYEIWKNLFLVE